MAEPEPRPESKSERDRLAAALAAELDTTRRELEEIATRLCLDPVVFARHPEPLQLFDTLAQVIGEVAAILRHSGPAADAIAAVRLDAVRDRLATRL